jgi:thioredoxin 1
MKTNQRIAFIVGLAIAVGVVIANKNTAPSHEAGSMSEAATHPLPRLVDLGAGKCIPCKAMAPILDELRTEYADTFQVVFIDVWENPTAAEPYNINLIPTQIFFDAEGQELWRHEGFLGKEDILAKWKELGVVM